MDAKEQTRPATVSDFITRTLRSRILSGQIEAGEWLRQNHVAKEFGVSSTPVREALRELAAEGLLVADPHRGSMVKGLTEAEVGEIYQLRLLLEPMLIEKNFGQIGRDDLQRCAELIELMDHEEDVAQWSSLNAQFHTILGGRQDGSRLARIVENLRDASTPYVSLSLYGREDERRRSNNEHREILSAHQRNDVGQATEIAKSHLRATIELIKLKMNEHNKMN